MQNVIVIVQIVLQLFPIIIDAVKSIEAAFPQAGQGAKKLAMVQGILENAYSTANTFSVSFQQIWPSLQAAVSSVVAMQNALGAFQKSTPAQQ